ncbi:MAG: HD domain-containing protein [Bacteroidia bacterium]
MPLTKSKIFNDPIYGFITISDELILQLIDHPYFQRLRRINQLGLSHLVYPGAVHTRFHHVLGCTFLMQQAIATLRSKGIKVTDDEEQAVQIAILLHDIGHGPFSHALENTLVGGVNHENFSNLFMKRLNEQFDGKLTLAIKIFNNKYHRKFLHQLISSQLDVDRLDYLRRDSFYSGVSEGVVGSERIIKMLNVVKDELVVEEKGIYSIEKFIVARRLMYWQVYLHKAVLSAEYMLVQTLKRAKELAKLGKELFATPALKYFLYNDLAKNDFIKKPEVLDHFALLDDSDLLSAFKVWTSHEDKILSDLCKNILSRKLYKIEISNMPISKGYVDKISKKIIAKYKISNAELGYYLLRGKEQNNAYNPKKDHIHILYKNGEIKDITEASDNFNIQALTKPVTKYFICYPKNL